MKMKESNNTSGFTFARKEPNGFTLVELIIAMTVIVLLAIIGLTVFSTIQRNARDVRRKADINAIAHALEDHYDQFSQDYYQPLHGTDFSAGQIPEDPVSTRTYTGTGAFSSPTGGTDFCVCAHLELPDGNSSQDAAAGNCNSGASGPTANYYCVKNRR
jgi:prepilin-type N-terminal cleavage/methylation domain-containing protein